MHEKRLTQRLTEYWDRLRNEAPLPQIERFNHGALEDVIGKCCLWRVEIRDPSAKTRLYTYEFVGAEMQQIIGSSDLIGTTLSPHFKDFPAARIMGKIGNAVENAAIVVDEGQFVNTNNKVIKYRSCLLPFGTQDGRVTNVLLGISWKAF
ncbi:MAG TPA: PAS domain-containing protein [Rickettsiales bacterium]|nr:PAS domain-containing protein [Rickettsiales bacterium]